MREERTSPPDGFFLVDKPAGITSHDVIAIARRALGVSRIGHAGTLDPDATGLLLLFVGRATRLMPYIEIEPKVYDAEIHFGVETDTDDSSGDTVRDAPIPTEAEVYRAIATLTGELQQEPPAFSAKQRDGRRAYRAARRGRPLELEVQTVHVFEWSAVHYENGVLRAHIVCGGGTYIRALARDLGRICGSAAHLATLRRTRIGRFSVADAVPAQTLSENVQLMLPPLAALTTLDRVQLSGESERKVSHGMRIPADSVHQRVALVGAAGNLVAIAELDDGDWKPRVVLADD